MYQFLYGYVSLGQLSNISKNFFQKLHHSLFDMTISLVGENDGECSKKYEKSDEKGIEFSHDDHA